MKKCLIFTAMILLSLFVCSSCSGVKAEIDFEKCVEVEFTGYNGEGSAVIQTDQGYVLSMLGDMNTLSAAELLASFKIEPPENNGALSNGDTVKINVKTDEEILKNAKVGVANTELTFTVSGLEEKPSADIFKDVSLKVTGSSPFCKLSVEYTGDLELDGNYSFSIVGTDDKDTFKDGDKVVVKLNENNALKDKYVLKETEHEYTVKADSVCLLSTEDLNGNRKEMLENAVKNTLDEQINKILANTNGMGSLIISKLTGYNALSVASSSAKITSVENVTFSEAYIGTSHETGSFGSVKDNHYIYYFYEADFTHNYKSTQTIHAVLVLQLSEPTATADSVTFGSVSVGARKDIATAQSDFITSDFAKISQ